MGANSVGVGYVKEDKLHRGQETPRNADAKHAKRRLIEIEMGELSDLIAFFPFSGFGVSNTVLVMEMRFKAVTHEFFSTV